MQLSSIFNCDRKCFMEEIPLEIANTAGTAFEHKIQQFKLQKFTNLVRLHQFQFRKQLA